MSQPQIPTIISLHYDSLECQFEDLPLKDEFLQHNVHKSSEIMKNCLEDVNWSYLNYNHHVFSLGSMLIMVLVSSSLLLCWYYDVFLSYDIAMLLYVCLFVCGMALLHAYGSYKNMKLIIQRAHTRCKQSLELVWKTDKSNWKIQYNEECSFGVKDWVAIRCDKNYFLNSLPSIEYREQGENK